jgi:hypothetical protein
MQRSFKHLALACVMSTMVISSSVGLAQTKKKTTAITDEETHQKLKGVKEQEESSFELGPNVDLMVYGSDKAAKKAMEAALAEEPKPPRMLLYGYIPVKKLKKIKGGLHYTIVVADSKKAAKAKAKEVKGFKRGKFVTFHVTPKEVRNLRLKEEDRKNGAVALFYNSDGGASKGGFEVQIKAMLKGPVRALKGEDLGLGLYEKKMD